MAALYEFTDRKGERDISKRFDPESQMGFPGSLIRNLDNPATRMAQTLQSLPAVKLARQSTDLPGVRAIQAFNDSPAMRQALELANSPMMQAMRELQDSATVQAARDLYDSSTIHAMREQLQGLSAMLQHQGLHDSAMMRMAEQLQNSPVGATTRKLRDSPILNGLRALESSSLLSALPRLKGTPFDPELIERAVAIAHRNSYGHRITDEVLQTDIGTVEEELNSYGDEPLEFRLLSERARRTILSLLYSIVVQFLVGIMANIAYNIALERFSEKGAVEAEITTSREAKRLARCDNGIEREIFAECRVVIGHGLRLRAEPGMKAQVLTTLPLGKLIMILDSSSERAWIHVEVELEGDLIDGWVARRYTTPFR